MEAGATMPRYIDQGPDAKVASLKSLTLTVYETLRNDVLTCRLLPGAKLRISDITSRFQVGNGAVREALSRLVADGLVDAVDQRGFRVTAMSIEDLMDVTQTRIEIESIALRKAIVLGDAAWESSILTACHEFSRATPPRVYAFSDVSSDWQALHAQFHRLLIGACGSSWLMNFHERLSEQSQRFRSLSTAYAKSERNFEREHRDIMIAAISRDADTAVKRLTDHYQLTADIIIGGQKAALTEDGDSGETVDQSRMA